MVTTSDWRVILASLKYGKCVVLIGPGLSTTAVNGELQNITTTLSRILAKQLESEREIEIQDSDNFPLVAQYFSVTNSADLLKDEVINFYKKIGIGLEMSIGKDTVFESLAALPISLFISTRHDHTLEYYLRACGKSPVERAYNFRGDRQTTLGKLGTADQPLIYQLLGSIDNPESLVLTENDLLDLLEKIIAENPALPNDLRSSFSEKSFIFLGCGLHNYYIRVLLHALGLHQSRERAFAPEAFLVDRDRDEFRTSVWFYKVGYKQLSLLNIDEREFIQELHKRWEEQHKDWDKQPNATAAIPTELVDRPKVFVSYVSEDQVFAEKLVEALKREGIDSWFDKQNLRCGDQWPEALKDAIGKNVDFFIVLLSQHLMDGVETYVHSEIEMALRRKSMRGRLKFIYPLQIDQSEQRLASLEQAEIQASHLQNLGTDVAELALDIKREFKKIQRR